MDKPISQVNKIIFEEDKVYQLNINVSIEQIGVTSNLVGGDSTVYSLTFTEIKTMSIPLTITIKKNSATMNQLIDEAISFNTRHDWQKEVPYGL
jgi:hypothetical protein